MATSKLSLLKRTYTVWSEHNASRLAAALALYTMMSLAPLLVVALTILSFKYGSQGAQEQIGGRAGTFVGGGGADAIKQMLQNSAANHKSGLIAGIIGFVIAVISGSSLFVSLQDSLNTIWDVKPRPDAGWKVMLRDRAMSAAMIIGAAIVLLASFVLSAVLSMVVKHLGGWLSGLSYLGDLVVSFAVITALFAMIYKFLPDVKIQWRDVWLGAAITAGLFIVGKYILTVYFRFASVASPYGAAGSLAALLIWIYYSSMLVFFGAAFTRVYAKAQGHPIEPNEYAMRMDTDDKVKAGTATPREVEQKKRNRIEEEAAAARRVTLRTVTVQSGDGSTTRTLVAAGAGMALGALGALGFANTTERRVRREAEAMDLHRRMKHLERRAGSASRLRDHLERMDYAKWVEDLEDQIHHAAHHARQAERRGKSWTQRLADAVKNAM